MVRIDGELDPESGEAVLTALGAVVDAELRAAGPGDMRGAAQRRADALAELARRYLDSSDRPAVAGERPHLTVTVDVGTRDETALAGVNYTATSGTVTFGPGESVKTVTVPVIGDTTLEANETFLVNLSAASGATIGDGQGQGTITDDDTSAGALTCPVSPVAPGASFTTTVIGGTTPVDWVASYAPGAPNVPWIGQYKYVPLPRSALVTMTAPESVIAVA
jgi:hypothetical protein